MRPLATRAPTEPQLKRRQNLPCKRERITLQGTRIMVQGTPRKEAEIHNNNNNTPLLFFFLFETFAQQISAPTL